MEDQGTRTAGYVELAGQTYGIAVDAFASANQRALGYAKSLYDIISRPYASSALEASVREGFDRAHQIVGLTVGELQTTGQKNAEVTEKLVAHAAKWQETWTEAVRGLLKTGIANITYVKDAAETSFDGFAKRVEELQSRATVSTN
ncbi:MAG: hypothetical protein JO060_05860 [Candidatus Eremiobacteraeota bacterium]|nr:hypothetical protein [Candidatus Eremiobacteraeota bacterium]MBV9645857.1 hypothetical protein [Candidatus Eremiobacteraeota bacterium]